MALEIIKKRQEIQAKENWGSSIFGVAPAWFKADLNARYSRDGKHLLLTTERGQSGNNPPGDAFLLNTDTLVMKQLDFDKRTDLKRRLEFVGFGDTGQKIYVARQYNVEVYSIDGAFEKEFLTGGGCTKYPISVVSGIMDDSMIIYGDTDGGVYTLDYASGKCHYLQRRAGRILIQFDLSPSGRVALLVYKDLTAAIWRVGQQESREALVEIPNTKVLAASFRPTKATDTFLTAGEDGLVGLWTVENTAMQLLRMYDHNAQKVGFATFSNKGEAIVTVAESEIVRIWEVATGKLLRPAVRVMDRRISHGAPLQGPNLAKPQILAK
jgi:hypothetical protein